MLMFMSCFCSFLLGALFCSFYYHNRVMEYRQAIDLLQHHRSQLLSIISKYKAIVNLVPQPKSQYDQWINRNNLNN